MRPVDWIVLTLVVGVSVTMIMPLINIVMNDSDFNLDRSKAITGMLSSIIAIVSMYVGAKIGRGGD